MKGRVTNTRVKAARVRVKVAVPRRARPQLPAYIELSQAAPGAHTTLYEGLRAQPVADALVDCRGRIQEESLMAAVKQARAEGLLTTAEWHRLRRELRRDDASEGLWLRQGWGGRG